jgi:protein gp37
MAKFSKIEWTHHTFNPWWGCMKVSAGCKNCYADTLATRYGHDLWGKNGQRRFFSEQHWQEPLRWNKEAERLHERHRVFCASMSDVFEDHERLSARLDEERSKLWHLIEETPYLDWLLLTKRPENVMSMIPSRWKMTLPPNIWIGTSVENPETAAERIPHLQAIPAEVRFLSVEPLLEAVPNLNLADIDWVIVGGESGAGARPMEESWVVDIQRQCKKAHVAFFFKQWGGVNKKKTGRLLKEREWNEIPQTSLMLELEDQFSLL